MTRWGVLGGFLGVTALLSLAACDTRLDGLAIPDPAALGPVTSIQAFGDAHTVDPCSLVDVNQLPTSLNGSLEPSDAFDDCPISVTLPDGTATDVRVGPLEKQNEEADTSLRPVAVLARGMTLYTAATNAPGFCDDYLNFSDGTALAIYASTSDPNSTANTCPAAEQLGRNAATQIAEGAIKHVKYQTGSVGPLDPCHLVSSATLTQIGMARAPAYEYPEMHECTWNPDVPNPSGDALYLQFVIGTQPSVLDPTTDSSAQIAGRATIDTRFSASSTSAWCDVTTGLNTYGDSSGNLVEIAMIEMHTGNANTTNACAMGNAVAAAVWLKLPKTG